MDADELHIRVIAHDGVEHRPPALEGWSVLEIVRDAGLPLKGECDGALQCVSCHVYVEPTWYDRLPSRSPEEEALLRTTQAVQPTSRLSCQILMQRELDGLGVTLAPGTEA